jgi:hypothetical protein
MADTTKDLTQKADEFLTAAGRTWKAIKDARKAVEPLTKGLDRIGDAFDLADKAASGQLPAYTGAIENLRVYVSSLRDRLADFAWNTENDWALRSGANVFNPEAMVKARVCLDQWIQNFAQLKILIQDLLPAVQSGQKLLSNSAVVGARSALAESSLPALDGFALEETVGNLNNSVRSIDIILPRLRATRMALR